MNIIVSMLFLFISVTTLASSNPLRRHCLEKNGQFVTLQIDQEQFGLCQFDRSLIGALELIYVGEIEAPESITNYTQKQKKCLGHIVTYVSQDTGFSSDICVFSDFSLIDLETLKSGRDDSRNLKLNQALGL